MSDFTDFFEKTIPWSEIPNFFENTLPTFYGDNFKGKWDYSLGEAWMGHFGSSFSHYVGGNNTLINNPLALMLGYEPGKLSRPVYDTLLGLGDNVTFTYGQQVNAVYGGPVIDIVRGPAIRFYSPWKWGIATIAAPAEPRADPWAEVAEASPAGPGAMGSIAHTRVVWVFGKLLSLSTTLMELWMRFGYEEYDKKTKSFDFKPNVGKGLDDLQLSMRMIPKRLMAIICHLEMAQNWLLLLRNYCEHAKEIYNGKVPGALLRLTKDIVKWSAIIGLGLAGVGIGIGIAAALAGPAALVVLGHYALKGGAAVLDWMANNVALSVLIIAIVVILVASIVGLLFGLKKL